MTSVGIPFFPRHLLFGCSRTEPLGLVRSVPPDFLTRLRSFDGDDRCGLLGAGPLPDRLSALFSASASLLTFFADVFALTPPFKAPGSPRSFFLRPSPRSEDHPTYFLARLLPSPNFFLHALCTVRFKFVVSPLFLRRPAPQSTRKLPPYSQVSLPFSTFH